MPSWLKKAAAAIIGVAALAIGGSAIATAASGSSTTMTVTVPSAQAPSSSFPAHGSAVHEDAEKAVTGANADKAKSAAVAYVGSGTAGDVTTDFSGGGYEVTVTKSDGSTVEVHLDSSFNVMQFAGHGDGAPPSGSSASPSVFG